MGIRVGWLEALTQLIYLKIIVLTRHSYVSIYKESLTVSRFVYTTCAKRNE